MLNYITLYWYQSKRKHEELITNSDEILNELARDYIFWYNFISILIPIIENSEFYLNCVVLVCYLY